MKLNHISAIIYKQFIDTLRNKTIILMMFLYPIITFAFVFLSNSSSEIVSSVSPMLITMHIIMSPIVCFSGVMSEEREKNTLRMLFVSNINGGEYLIGISSCLLSFLIASTLPYYFLFSFRSKQATLFFCASIFGISCSSIIGAIIGILSKNQSTVGTIASPVSMVLGLLPIMANFNKLVNKVSSILYSQKIYSIIFSLDNASYSYLDRDVFIFTLNIIVLALAFVIIYSMKGAHIYD